jgi:ABC transport system ATP-binding/permease protein
MQFLSVENASKSYGDKSLFRNVNFTISKGDKVALIAKNGSGKTTLLKIIAGQEGVEGESAKVILSRNIDTIFLTQDPDLHPENTIFEEILESEHQAVQAVKLYKLAMDSGDTDDLQNAMVLMDQHQAWDTEAQLSIVLNNLNIIDTTQKIKTLSGGQKKRVALAKVILAQSDFLILDEPTNHLDIEMIEWLESYLQNVNITLFMVTHDRYFLDNICNQIFELDHSDLFVYRGSYTQYLEKKEARLLNESANLDKSKKLFKSELEWMRRMPQARTTKAKSRIEDFNDLKEDIGNRSYSKDELSINIEVSRLGNKIVELHNISKKFGDKNLFSNFSYKFKKAERVGVVGKNGVGKSTFIKMITGEEETDSGKIVIGETVVFGHYHQENVNLNGNKTIIDTIRDIAEFIPLAKGMKLTAETLLERFLFPRSQQRVYVSQLSGGEKRRLHLLTIIMKNPNFLILDEPTNDLDIVTLNVLEEFLMDYPGCLIVISHDRYFMDKLVDHIFVIEGDGNIKDYNGNYSEYRIDKSAENKAVAAQVANSNIVEAPTKNTNKNEFELKKEIKSLEKQMEKLTSKKEEITAKFLDASISPDQISKLSKELEGIQAELNTKEERWLLLSEDLES